MLNTIYFKMARKERYYEYKTIKTGGSLHHLFRENPENNWIHHNPDGPAIEPLEGTSKKNRKYYIFGIEHSEEEFKLIKQSQEGLPWYKNPSMKGNTRF